MKAEKLLLQVRDLTKKFGDTTAADHISFQLRKGEVLAVFGENGSGKTTLVNMIAGIYYPDAGAIWIDGQKVFLNSPAASSAYHIGIVHQHYMLIDKMTALENIAISMPDSVYNNISEVQKKCENIMGEYKIYLDLQKKVRDMSISEKQNIEILKALVQEAEILILDEPSAVLTPQETEGLFQAIQRMKQAGKGIILISHKMKEVLYISDRILVLRHGKLVDTVNASESSKEELLKKMTGHAVDLELVHTTVKDKECRLSVKHLCYGENGFTKKTKKSLQDISFNLYAGEILGIAGIAGSGQEDLCELLAGVRTTSNGTIKYFHDNGASHIENWNVRKRMQNGIHFGFIPEDRMGMGLIPNSNIVENFMLRTGQEMKNFFQARKQARSQAIEVIRSLKIKIPSMDTPIRVLSGGNIQKILLGREVLNYPPVLIAVYPVRGLDVNSAHMVYTMLDNARKHRVAVIFVGEDLDTLIALCDRIMVMDGGKIQGIVDAKQTSSAQLGYLMMAGG